MTKRDPLLDLWRSNTEEKFTMSIAELTTRAHSFQGRIKRRNLTEYLAAVLVIGIFGWMTFLIPVPVIKLGAVLIVAATIYVCWLLNRRGSGGGADAVSGAENLMQFHRQELIRQRDALRSVWRWYLLPFVPGLIVFIVGTNLSTLTDLGFWSRLAASGMNLTFVGGIFGGVWAINHFAANKLDRDIQALENDRED